MHGRDKNTYKMYNSFIPNGKNLFNDIHNLAHITQFMWNMSSFRGAHSGEVPI